METKIMYKEEAREVILGLLKKCLQIVICLLRLEYNLIQLFWHTE